MFSNAANEEKIKCKKHEIETNENKELQLARASIQEKMERMSNLKGQLEKLSKRMRYQKFKF